MLGAMQAGILWYARESFAIVVFAGGHNLPSKGNGETMIGLIFQS